DVKVLDIDLLSLSAHKFYGPKGIGALYRRRSPRVAISAQMHGGGHERGLRAGTLPTHQIVGMGCAAAIAQEVLPKEFDRLTALRDELWSSLSDISGLSLNGHPSQRLPGALNISVSDVEGEALLLSLPEFALSTGSACTSASLEPSYVLRALGLSDALAHSSLRVSLGRFSDQKGLALFSERLHQVIPRLRGSA
ncbi:MAG: aminotransferase class V-fold PLP-dependent enzyme, partial [Congregibacter sp.]|nr:aminotransferase class V-fold PLP-dependent enzyme [Congregibacter sp.]